VFRSAPILNYKKANTEVSK